MRHSPFGYDQNSPSCGPPKARSCKRGAWRVALSSQTMETSPVGKHPSRLRHMQSVDNTEEIRIYLKTNKQSTTDNRGALTYETVHSASTRVPTQHQTNARLIVSPLTHRSLHSNRSVGVSSARRHECDFRGRSWQGISSRETRVAAINGICHDELPEHSLWLCTHPQRLRIICQTERNGKRTDL